ncbi:hypothetical protein [Pseudomonas sp.]|uniref:MrpH family fimbial adhesin n=1 Tax=Pseudomonas sp. TaxID=306 RepID=UPI0026247CE2|nr:hypothetical protein [Pseudomonas sp.]
MKIQSLSMTFLLMAAASNVNAWHLVNKVNADARQLPGGLPTDVSASGTASSHVSGNPNQYPGKVTCSSGSSCFFGPIAYSLLIDGRRTVAVMGCTSNNNCASRITDTNVSVNTSMTWDQAITAWRQRFGSTVSRTYGYVYSTDPGSTAQICAAWAAYGPPGTGYAVIAGTDTCARPPIPANRCDVTGGDVKLDHGQLKKGSITGARKEATRQVTCTRSASVRYIVSASNPVDLGNGISSAITVNGVSAGQMINLPGGTSTLRIASTLTEKAASPGPFSKTIILIQSFI